MRYASSGYAFVTFDEQSCAKALVQRSRSIAFAPPHEGGRAVAHTLRCSRPVAPDEYRWEVRACARVLARVLVRVCVRECARARLRVRFVSARARMCACVCAAASACISLGAWVCAACVRACEREHARVCVRVRS